MIRVLVMIAVTGFLVSVVTLSTAIGIAGPEAIARGAWGWDAGRWNFHDREVRPAGPTIERQIAWTGDTSLVIDVPAEVRYTQAPGAGQLTVSGAKAAVDDVELVGGTLRFKQGDHDGRHRRRMGRLTIVMTAPNVTRFEIQGRSKLTIEGYRQARLRLDLSGNSEVSVSGEATALDLDISGSAETDLSNLKVRDAKVDISGSGDATLAPTDSATLDISGSGDVTLLTTPPRLETSISGSGEVHQSSRAPAKPAAQVPTTPKVKT
jgi:hypothetical protein